MYYEETFTKQSNNMVNKIRINIPNEISSTGRTVALAVEPGNRYSFAIQNFRQILFRDLVSSISGQVFTAGHSNQYFNVMTGQTETTTASNDRIYVSTSQPFTFEVLDGFGNTITDDNSVNPLIILNITNITSPTAFRIMFASDVNYATSINPSNFANYIINRFVRINYIERESQVAYGNTSLGVASSMTEYIVSLLSRFESYQAVLTTVASYAAYYTNFLMRSRKLYIE